MPITDIRVEEQDLSEDDLTVEARDGEALEIVARGVSGGDADTMVEEYVREELMTAYPADGGDDELLDETTVETMHTDLMAALREMGYRVPVLSIPEGQTFTLSSTTDTGQATVLYRELGVAGVDGNQPGGPGNKSRTFVSTGRATVDLAAEAGPTTVEVDTSRQPAQLDTWPFGEDVPPNREYDLQAIMLQASADSGDSAASLDRFRLTSDETDFLARESSLVSADLAQFPSVDMDVLPMLFDGEPSFSPGADLDVTVEVSGADDGTVVVDCTTVWYRRSV